MKMCSTHIGQARRRQFGRYVWATPPHLNHLTFLQELGRQAMARYRERKATECLASKASQNLHPPHYTVLTQSDFLLEPEEVVSYETHQQSKDPTRSSIDCIISPYMY